MITVATAMTPDPITIRPGESVLRAAQLMDELNVGALPVCRGIQVVGVVTDRDITVRAIAAGLDPATTPVDVVMSDRVRRCTRKQSVAEVLRRMAAVQIRRLMVVDEDDRLVGIISLGDIAEHQGEGVEEALRGISTPSQPDRGGHALTPN
jgi:CBS domain-containing protein